MELNQSRKKVTDGVCLMVWVHVGQLVDECHSLLCQVTIEQEKRCLGKSIITTDKRSAVYLLWHTRTNTHAPYLYIHGSYTLTHARSHTKYLHSAYPSRLPSCLLRSVWRDCTCVYLWGTYVCVHTVFSYVCVCVWLCGCTAIIITLVNTHMSTYWSLYRWAMRYLRLRRALWICLDFYWDHTVRPAQVQLKITSRARLLALRRLYRQH